MNSEQILARLSGSQIGDQVEMQWRSKGSEFEDSVGRMTEIPVGDRDHLYCNKRGCKQHYVAHFEGYDAPERIPCEDLEYTAIRVLTRPPADILSDGRQLPQDPVIPATVLLEAPVVPREEVDVFAELDDWFRSSQAPPVPSQENEVFVVDEAPRDAFAELEAQAIENVRRSSSRDRASIDRPQPDIDIPVEDGGQEDVEFDEQDAQRPTKRTREDVSRESQKTQEDLSMAKKTKS